MPEKEEEAGRESITLSIAYVALALLLLTQASEIEPHHLHPVLAHDRFMCISSAQKKRMLHAHRSCRTPGSFTVRVRPRPDFTENTRQRMRATTGAGVTIFVGSLKVVQLQHFGNLK